MRNTHVAACVFVLGLVAGQAAWAQGACPGPQDRGRAIAVEFQSGLVEVHRTEDGQIWSIEAFEAGVPIYRLEVAHGTHLLSFVEIVDGKPDPASRVTYDYGRPVSQLPVPEPSGRFEVDVFVTDGGGSGREGQMQAYGAMTEVTIGECRYDMIPVLIAYATEDMYVEQINYLPELGIGYLVDSQTADDPGGPIPAVAIRIAD